MICMRNAIRLLALVIGFLEGCSSAAIGQAPAPQPLLAVVKITLPAPRRPAYEGDRHPDCLTSTGSGTIIHTAPGKTVILTCAHLWCHPNTETVDRRMLRRPVWVDVPSSEDGKTQTVGIRVTRIDPKRDLAQVEVPIGPMPNVCHVLPPGRVPGKWCVSLGYDKALVPAVREWSALASLDGNKQLTIHKPVSGRSGGALIDRETGRLVGVVVGYREVRETSDPRSRVIWSRGVYASHKSVLEFLGHVNTARAAAAPPTSRPPPRTWEEWVPPGGSPVGPPGYAPATPPGGT